MTEIGLFLDFSEFDRLCEMNGTSSGCTMIWSLSNKIGIIIKKSCKIWQIIGGGIIYYKYFISAFFGKWKNKILVQTNQKEVFDEWFVILPHGWYSFYE